jgi:dTDP-4-dehydrorhamnose reductase
MLGHSIFNFFYNEDGFNTFGTLRSDNKLSLFNNNQRKNIFKKVNGLDIDTIEKAVLKSNADIIINCIGLIKQEGNFDNPKIAYPINSILPHSMAILAHMNNARLIHFSTDCVFTGKKGNYHESDEPDSDDIYGLSKRFGEVRYKNSITLRTSIIGHELESKKSLVEWFLNSSSEVNGFKNAIFSGLPTIEIARIIKEYIIPNNSLSGLYHLSADPINKFDLLQLIKKTYNKDITIYEDTEFCINRSLNSDMFRDRTGYNPPEWKKLIRNMFVENNYNNK